ncbi:MAG: hypothetical protein M0Z53_05240 [Thermaerobacter sp.]|nr:hypothetical protein [Thermaerobacter sp.]
MGELFERISLYSTIDRSHLTELKESREFVHQKWGGMSFSQLLRHVVAARNCGAPVIAFLGSQVLQLGLQPYLISLIQDGWLTHIAVTGAGSEYDVELAIVGQAAVVEERGDNLSRCGMWRETGNAIHRAIARGWHQGLGYGESLGRYVEERPDDFPFREKSLFFQAYVYDIPYTCHISIGLDEVHAHPQVDFGALGGSSGRDFRVFCASVASMENGVFLNFGSSVTGVEVFLKAVSIARNLGYTVQKITTANFDVVCLGDYHRTVGYDDWDYYYRPRKNVVHRPTSLGGRGFHFEGDHWVTIPALRAGLRNQGGNRGE